MRIRPEGFSRNGSRLNRRLLNQRAFIGKRIQLCFHRLGATGFPKFLQGLETPGPVGIVLNDERELFNTGRLHGSCRMKRDLIKIQFNRAIPRHDLAEHEGDV